MKRKSTVPTLGTAAVLAFALSSCASAQSDASGATADGALVLEGEEVADASLYQAALEDDDKLIVYSGAGEKSQMLQDDAFTADTGIEVESVNLSPSRLKERILSEAGASQFAGDVIITSDASIAKELLDAGVFVDYSLPEDFAIDESSVHSDGKYFTAFYPSYSLAYNHAALEGDPPTSWADLLEPEYAGNIGIVNAGVGGSAAALTRFQLDVLGEDYLRAYAANGARVFDTMAAEAEAMGRGEVLIGSMTTGSADRAAQDGAPLAPFVPEEGFAVYDYFAAMTPQGIDSPAAQVYMNWYFSSKGQQKQVEEGAYSARTDVAPPTVQGAEMPPLDSDLVYRITPEEALEVKDEDLAIWNEIFNIAG